jgi:hypothetical protein
MLNSYLQPSASAPPSLPDPTSSDTAIAQTTGPPVGVIVGSVIGGVIVLAVLGIAAYYLLYVAYLICP